MGRRLKTARLRLRMTIGRRGRAGWKNLMAAAATAAKMRLLAGPAREIKAVSLRGSSR